MMGGEGCNYLDLSWPIPDLATADELRPFANAATDACRKRGIDIIVSEALQQL
jgi:hypothetical protein